MAAWARNATTAELWEALRVPRGTEEEIQRYAYAKQELRKRGELPEDM